jgi:hypothetical protein
LVSAFFLGMMLQFLITNKFINIFILVLYASIILVLFKNKVIIEFKKKYLN